MENLKSIQSKYCIIEMELDIDTTTNQQINKACAAIRDYHLVPGIHWYLQKSEKHVLQSKNSFQNKCNNKLK